MRGLVLKSATNGMLRSVACPCTTTCTHTRPHTPPPTHTHIRTHTQNALTHVGRNHWDAAFGAEIRQERALAADFARETLDLEDYELRARDVEKKNLFGAAAAVAKESVEVRHVTKESVEVCLNGSVVQMSRMAHMVTW